MVNGNEPGEELPVIQAPATVIPPAAKTPAEEVRAVVKDDARYSEEAKKTQGQRNISDMWEGTQRYIALSVTWASLSVAAFLAVGLGDQPTDVQIASTVFLYGVANLVIGFYFGRTNHTKVGGGSDESRDS